MDTRTAIVFILLIVSRATIAQNTSPYTADPHPPAEIPGMTLDWHDEFNVDGKPDPANWKYEQGFVRNEELQWYQPDNASCQDGLLIIEAKREKVANSRFNDSSRNWRFNRKFAEYTSSSLNTRGLKQWQYGRLVIRARIDTSKGAWPAIWTLGINGHWPLNGEVDIMEFYRVKNTPSILANIAWGSNGKGNPKWNTKIFSIADFISKDPEWTKKFHVWRMDWNKDSINLYIDDKLLNTAVLSQTINPDGSNPFLQPQYLLLNLAIGRNGGDPSDTKFPVRYEVDYVRYYKSHNTPY